MAQVLITGILALFLLQLAAGQSTACQNALDQYTANIADCTPTEDNPLIICTGECRGYYDAVVNNCDDSVSQVAIAALCEISCLRICLV